jgi:methionyl-tRNA formyltransferase
MKIGIISSSDICIPLLQVLKANNISAFVYAEIEDKNSFIAVAQYCSYAAVPVKEANAAAEVHKWLADVTPDAVFVLGYRHLLDIDRLSLPLKNRFFNIHFGPLPAYKGPNPVFWQLKKGLPTVTVTIHRMTPKFDAGPVVWSKQINREAHFTYGYVQMVLSQVLLEGAILILSSLANNQPVPEQPQDKSKSVYYNRPGIISVSIQWESMGAAEIINLINACNPWNKGAITLYNNNEVKLLDAELLDLRQQTIPAGTILNTKDRLEVVCLTGQVLQVNILTVNGIFIPSRFAGKFGLAEGQRFS